MSYTGYSVLKHGKNMTNKMLVRIRVWIRAWIILAILKRNCYHGNGGCDFSFEKFKSVVINWTFFVFRGVTNRNCLKI